MADLINIKQVPLSKAALLAIAYIIRASADLEDVVDLWICKLSKLSQSKATVMLGRSNISTKIGIAEGLAALGGQADLHKTVFDENVTRLLRCRNAVAHGQYIGKAPSGWIFSTSVTIGYEGDQVAKRADGYSTATLKAIGSISARRVSAMDEVLGLKLLRDKRQTQALREHLQGQPRKKSSSKQKRPPQSSEA